MHTLSEKNIYRAFLISLFLKTVNALLEIMGGILFLFTGTVTKVLSFLIPHELIEDPKDFLANKIQHLLPFLSSHTQFFISFYLLSHGIVKIFLVYNLLKKKLWAYPLTILVLILFILYQIFRLFHVFSLFLFALTLFDFLLIILTWHEYQVTKKHMEKNKNTDL